MGIYADIQSDLKEAMDDDLADAVATLTISETVSSISYNPVDGTPSSTPVINSMRCVIVDADLKDETDPSSDTTINDLEVIVLDSEKTTNFRVGISANIKRLNDDVGVDYVVAEYKVDPARATHSLELRRD